MQKNLHFSIISPICLATGISSSLVLGRVIIDYVLCPVPKLVHFPVPHVENLYSTPSGFGCPSVVTRLDTDRLHSVPVQTSGCLEKLVWEAVSGACLSGASIHPGWPACQNLPRGRWHLWPHHAGTTLAFVHTQHSCWLWPREEQTLRGEKSDRPTASAAEGDVCPYGSPSPWKIPTEHHRLCGTGLLWTPLCWCSINLPAPRVAVQGEQPCWEIPEQVPSGPISLQTSTNSHWQTASHSWIPLG